MNELISVGIVLALLVSVLLTFAPRLSAWLVESKARRLPPVLSKRMQEEWRAELDALPGRASQLAFGIALTLTRRRSFALEEDSLFAASSRPPISVATFGGWPSVVLCTTLVAAAIAYGASFLIQPLYQSHILLTVVPPQIPARFIEAAPSTSVSERQRAFSQTVFSHGTLQTAIAQFDLYKSERRGRPDGQDTLAAIERMRSDISVDVHGDGVRIAYTSPHPRTALIVTEHLAVLALRANSARRDDASEATLKLLKAQIEDVKSRILKGVTRTELPASSDADADLRALEHDSLKTTYRDLLLKREKARVSANGEAAQVGEQFRVMEGPRLPEAPISPNRTRLTLLGALVGFSLSVAMMIAGRGGSFRGRKELVAHS